MNPIFPSTLRSTIAALLGLTLSACGGSPMGLDDEPPALAPRERAPVHDHAKAAMAQLPSMPQERIASNAAATDHRPQLPASVGCALQADELVPLDAEPEAQQAPQAEFAPDELVPEPVLEGVNDEPR